MISIDIISLFPEMFAALDSGIVGRAQRNELMQLQHYPLRDYTDDPSGRVDDRPYGGGPGMVMQYKPLSKALEAAKLNNTCPGKVLYLSPQGKPLNQSALQNFAQQTHLTLLCGRYEGIDERIITDYVDEEWSVGEYVVSGGELPAMLLIDGITRLLPGALGHDQSAEQDSFSQGLLDCPHYTRPEVIQQHTVPAVLLSGDHAAIKRWRLKQSLGKTWQKRPDLLKRQVLGELEQMLLDEYIKDRSEE
jgi:tRNA (guanine37-N1)-methyltransferase